ncbi:MAG: site-specific DNA-methyltransferase [Anaerolineales bacterium]|jgi:site-specific DNA-methyltransferase (adenine-specific)|nr:site-specific DNA-methyltransferase [Anaerolineales bacterium]
MPRKTKTSSFGVSKREGHDSTTFYQRSIFENAAQAETAPAPEVHLPTSLDTWADRIYCQSAEQIPLPDQCVGLAFTSPPYNVGKEYDADLSLDNYLDFIQRVGREVYRVLQPGGRYVINIANVGRKPYLPLHAHFYQVHQALGFLPMGEIIWQKARGANASCAWGSWKSARSPRLRDLHEYLLVFAKSAFSRPDKGESDITSEEFMQSTLSVWQVKPESARKVGHPAPFPVELAERVIKLYSFVGDVVLDPFAGSGTTCIAARLHRRHYVGLEISPEYCALANRRLQTLTP